MQEKSFLFNEGVTWIKNDGLMRQWGHMMAQRYVNLLGHFY